MSPLRGSHPSRGPDKTRVLVVEDEADIAGLVKHTLERSGDAVVDIAASGDQALKFASEQALQDYTDSKAQLEWYKVYLPIREESATHDITN